MKTVIALCTFYKDVQILRFKLALQTVRFLIEAGYAVVIVDGSSDPNVSIGLSNAGAEVFSQREKGMGAGKREAVQRAIACGAEIVFMMEPERPDLVRSIETIVKPIKEGLADAVHAGRTKGSFDSYPAFQAELEMGSNRLYGELVGEPDFDAFFGPVAFSSEVALRFLKFNPKDYGAEDTYVQVLFPVLLRKQGFRVACVNIDFIYDSAQKAEEEMVLSEEMRQKRKWQSETVISGIRAILETRERS